ncbi:hypothetical protein, partial [Enterococcus faecium]
QINSKGFQGVFSIFFYTKKMLVKFTNIKKYRADRRTDLLSQIFLLFHLNQLIDQKNPDFHVLK